MGKSCNILYRFLKNVLIIMSTEGMAVNIRKSWKTVFSKISPVLGNVEYNYHDSLQARLMSDGTFVDQPSVYTLSSSSFYRSRVNKEAG